jgi:ribonucleoside-diphosphate reductase alpha chain
VAFEHVGQHYRATFGHYPDGAVGELFIDAAKVGSMGDIVMADAAVAVSLALQHGCPLDTLRRAMRRNPDGSPMGAIAKALDLIQEQDTCPDQ